MVDKLRAPGWLVSRHDLEAKLSHLADLRSRVDDAGASVADVAADETSVLARARKKVLDQGLENRALTPPMSATTAQPVRAGTARAARGEAARAASGVAYALRQRAAGPAGAGCPSTGVLGT